MPKYVYSTDIDSPPEKVWDIISDFGGIYRYSPMITASHSTTISHDGVGAERACDVFLGMGGTRERIISWDEGHSYELEMYQMSRMPLERALVTFQVTPNGSGTKVTSTMEPTFKFGAVGRVLGVVLGPLMKRMFATIVAGLKHYAETGQEVHSMRGLRMAAVQID